MEYLGIRCQIPDKIQSKSPLSPLREIIKLSGIEPQILSQIVRTFHYPMGV